jgi:O-antigen/teichoic acid export membrane protein
MRYRYLTRNSLGVGSLKLSAAVTHLAMNALLARLLTPASMGAFLLMISVTTFAGIIGQFGLNQTVVRALSYARGQADTSRIRSTVLDVIFLGTISAMGVTGALFIGVGDWLAMRWLDSPEIAALVPQLALWTLLIALHSLMAESLRGLNQLIVATIFDSTRPLAPALAISAVLLVGWLSDEIFSLSTVVAITIGCYALATVFCGVILAGFLPKNTGPHRSRRWELITTAWPFMVHQTAWIGVNYSTLWILAIFASKQEVAFYGTAFLFIQTVAFPMVVLYAVLSPKIAEMYIQDKLAQIEELLRRNTTIVAIPSLCVLAVMMLFGERMLVFVFGAPYSASYPILFMFGLGQIFNLWGGASAHALAMTGHQRLLMSITVFCGVVSVVSALVLVRRYGALGIAGAYSIGLACHNVAATLAVHRRLNIWPQMYLYRLRCGR